MQVSILELLKLSLTHKEILEKALVETTIPNNLDAKQFQAVVGHLIVPHYLSFSEDNDMSLNHLHNIPLHIEVMIHKSCFKHVLIDGEAGLNICILNLVKALGYSKDVVDPRRKTIIKSYDDAERSLKGLVILPIKVGLVQKSTICRVLDLNLSYTKILGSPWIHEM